MPKLQYAMRVEKLKRHHLTKAHNHNARIIVEHEKHIDHTLSKNNQELIDTTGKTLNELVNDRIEELGIKGIRKDANLVMEMVVSCSPEYFRPDDPDRAKYYHQDKLDAWKDAVVESIKKEFGDNLISAKLHVDETTPHIHFSILPIEQTQKKRRQSKQQKARGEEPEYYTAHSFNSKKLFNPEYLRYLQEELPRAVKHLGIERGLKGSKAKHMKSNEYRQIVEAANNDLDKTKRPSFNDFKKKVLKNLGKVSVFNFKDKMDTLLDLAYEHMNKKWRKKVNTLEDENKDLRTSLAAINIEKNQAVERLEFYDEFVTEYADTPDEFISSFTYQIEQNKVLNNHNEQLKIESTSAQYELEKFKEYHSKTVSSLEAQFETTLDRVTHQHQTRENELQSEVIRLDNIINPPQPKPRHEPSYKVPEIDGLSFDM